MEEKTFKAFCDVLRDKYKFDELDIVEFVMEYEKRTGEKIPDEWFLPTAGIMKTVKLK